MECEVTKLVNQFESGQINRRQLVAGLGSLVALLSTHQPTHGAETASTYEAVELNHIALRVTYLLRIRDFYKKHLGMTVVRDGGERNCFLTCGKKNFVALFRSDKAGMDHYC